MTTERVESDRREAIATYEKVKTELARTELLRETLSLELDVALLNLRAAHTAYLASKQVAAGAVAAPGVGQPA